MDRFLSQRLHELLRLRGNRGKTIKIVFDRASAARALQHPLTEEEAARAGGEGEWVLHSLIAAGPITVGSGLLLLGSQLLTTGVHFGKPCRFGAATRPADRWGCAWLYRPVRHRHAR